VAETLRERLARARLYVVTDARARTGDLSTFLDSILGAGTDIVQLREKTAEAGDLLRFAQIFRDAADRHRALFILNDRADVAIACGADGVHVGQNDLPVTIAGTLVGEDDIVGLSCHSEAEHASAPDRADYLTAGPVWATPTKPGRRSVGIELVRSASRNVQRPWFAVGGIDGSNISEIVDAGARRIVVVRAVTEADDPAAAVRALVSKLPG
jgi:thiamine-phosphate pyrophosphorylase